MAREADPPPEELRRREAELERTERDRLEHAESDEEARAAKRRADKAAYLEEKLSEQADADRDA